MWDLSNIIILVENKFITKQTYLGQLEKKYPIVMYKYYYIFIFYD